MNRIDRLTAIILMLQGRRVVRAEEVAERFEISLRTVYRDMAALGEAGVPLVSEAGVGYSLMRGYHLPPVMFTEAEAAALFMSRELAEKFGDGSLLQSLDGALEKVRAALPEERKDYLSQMGNLVGVWSSAEEKEGVSALMMVQEAVVRRCCLTIHYDTGGKGETKQRVVEGLGVVFYGNHWHLIAHCRLRKEVRDFRVDRIRSLETLEEFFERKESFSVLEYLEQTVAEMPTTSVLLRCEAWVVERLLADAPLRLVSKETESDGRIKLEGLAYCLEWMSTFLLSLGKAVEVLEPPELQQLLRSRAEEALKWYS